MIRHRLRKRITGFSCISFNSDNLELHLISFQEIAFSDIKPVIRKAQEANLGVDIKDIHQVLTYADDVNLICGGIGRIERNVIKCL